MAAPPPKLDAAGVNALLETAFPGIAAGGPQVTEVTPGRVRVVRPYGEGLLRPGGVISGPTLMSLADTAAYALVLAHAGDQLMAVTSQLNISFLRGAAPGDLTAEAEMLRLGRTPPPPRTGSPAGPRRRSVRRPAPGDRACGRRRGPA